MLAYNVLMTVVDEYLASLQDPEKSVIAHLVALVRRLVPHTTEELSYAMPAFKYKGKGLVAIIANKDFLSVYPFCSIDRLGLDLSAFEQTKGSIHFTIGRPVSDGLLTQIVEARKKLIEG